MATYNGEKYIMEQLGSILDQLNLDDEMIIVDDSSKDNTVHLIKSLNDRRIKIIINKENMGHVFSFAKSISFAQNEIIFLSDQDDVWIKERLTLMKNKLIDNDTLLLSSNFNIIYMNRQIRSFSKKSLKSADSTKYWFNILGIFKGERSYYGCAMAFKKRLVDLILPIPIFVESHDLWIALAGNLLGSNIHIEDKTITRRLHGNNVSNPQRNLLFKIKSRFIFGMSVITLLYRIKVKHLNCKCPNHQ